MSTETLRNFDDGRQVDAADGRTCEVINPATGEGYAAAPVSSAVLMIACWASTVWPTVPWPFWTCLRV